MSDLTSSKTPPRAREEKKETKKKKKKREEEAKKKRNETLHLKVRSLLNSERKKERKKDVA